MTDSWQTRAFGTVQIEWRAASHAYDVRVLWQGSLIAATTLDTAAPQLPFSARSEDGRRQVAGLIARQGSGGGELVVVFLQYPGGSVADVVLWPPGPPPPPPPPPDEPSSEETAVSIEAGEHDLFPYVYLRPWPGPTDAERADRFVSYVHDCAASPDTFYCRLAALRPDRAAMEQEAVTFIDGRPPYEGQFLQAIRRLDGPIKAFGAVDATLRGDAVVTLARLKGALEHALHMSWDEIVAYVRFDPSFPAQLDRAWQNLFALVVELGYDERLLDDLVRTIVMARLVQRVAEPPEDGAGEERWTPARVRDGVWATVVLPEAVFPLPPAAPPPAPAAAPDGHRLARGARGRAGPFIRPYAIGDLQLVRQKLLCYEPGEVSAVENVLRGESKETTRRSMARRSEVTADETLSDQETGTELLGSRSDLLEETGNTLRLDYKLDGKTTYGPPAEGAAVGHVEVLPNEDGKPQSDALEQAARFARAVTARTAQRLRRRAARRHVVASVDESETTVVTRFDGASAAANTTGVYRWVNKVYQAHVVNYGERLILEVLIRDPARAYVSGEQSLQGLSLVAPVPLAELGVATFRDISREPGAAGDFAALAARYQAGSVAPPPPPRTVCGTSFESGAELRAQEVSVPEGYRSVRARVTASWPEGVAATELHGIAGGQPFRLKSASQEVTVTLALARAETVPIVVGWRGLGASSAQGATEDPPAGCLATVEIEAELSEPAFEGWQIATYDALASAFQRQRDQYLAAAGARAAGAATRNPLASREAVRRQLQNDVQRLLLARVLESTGQDVEDVVGEPRYAQLFEQAFEWREMSFSFLVRTGDAPDTRAFNRYAGEDELFTAFLQAGFARVLLPVAPRFAFGVPYFLASGTIWTGPDPLAPAHHDSIELVNELKSAGLRARVPSRRSAPWEIRVPTSLVVLQASSDLPCFRQAKAP